MTPADFAAARKRAADEIERLRSLLAASPEPTTALPEEVCTCADKVDTGHTLQCREPGPPKHRVALGGRS